MKNKKPVKPSKAFYKYCIIKNTNSILDHSIKCGYHFLIDICDKCKKEWYDKNCKYTGGKK